MILLAMRTLTMAHCVHHVERHSNIAGGTGSEHELPANCEEHRSSNKQNKTIALPRRWTQHRRPCQPTSHCAETHKDSHKLRKRSEA